MKSLKIFDIIYMKEKQLLKIANRIKQLEANIDKSYEVEESRQEIERIMGNLTMAEILLLDDLLFQWE